MSNVQGKGTKLAADQKLIDGTRKHLATARVLILGKSYGLADIIAVLQGRADAASAVVQAKAFWRARIQDETKEYLETDAFIAAYCKALRANFGDAHDNLADFGLLPPKPRKVRTAAEKLATVAKAHATRVARHTVGKRAKALIKGAAPAPEPAPVTAPVAGTAPAAAPAPAAGTAVPLGHT